MSIIKKVNHLIINGVFLLKEDKTPTFIDTI